MAILINGNGYSPVTAQEDADLYAGLIGDGRYVLGSVGNAMAHEVVSANLVRILDGVLVTHGRMIYITAGSSDDFTIPVGSQGVTNYYIIGYRLYTDSSSNEHCEKFVRQMSSASATIEEASFRDGATESYVSMYRITQPGITIGTVEPLYTLTAGLGGKLDGAGLVSDYNSIISSHGTDTDAPSTSVIYKLYQSFQDGVTSVYNAIVSNGVTPASKALSAIVAGINAIRSGGDATAGQILSTKTAYVNKTLVTGSMANNGSVTKAINPGGSYTIPAGYHDGTGKVTANTGGNAAAGEILKDKTAYVGSTLVTGTMPNKGAVTASIPAGGTYTIPAGYHNGSGKVTAGTKTLKIVKVGSYDSGDSSKRSFNVATYVSKGCNINNFALRNVKQLNWYNSPDGGYYGDGTISMTLSGNTLSIAAWKGADRDLDGELRNHYITADVYVYYVE